MFRCADTRCSLATCLAVALQHGEAPAIRTLAVRARAPATLRLYLGVFAATAALSRCFRTRVLAFAVRWRHNGVSFNSAERGLTSRLQARLLRAAVAVWEDGRRLHLPTKLPTLPGYHYPTTSLGSPAYTSCCVALADGMPGGVLFFAGCLYASTLPLLCACICVPAFYMAADPVTLLQRRFSNGCGSTP